MKLITTFLPAALLLLGTLPTSAQSSGLLPPGSRPPDFTAPAAGGKPCSLRALLGSKRIVLVFGPSIPFLQGVQNNAAQFNERDLVVLAREPDIMKAWPMGIDHLPTYLYIDRDRHIAQLYGVAGGDPAFYLIGKDGHIKMAQRHLPTNAELFAAVDAMPMRQQEMRGHK